MPHPVRRRVATNKEEGLEIVKHMDEVMKKVIRGFYIHMDQKNLDASRLGYDRLFKKYLRHIMHMIRQHRHMTSYYLNPLPAGGPARVSLSQDLSWKELSPLPVERPRRVVAPLSRAARTTDIISSAPPTDLRAVPRGTRVVGDASPTTSRTKGTVVTSRPTTTTSRSTIRRTTTSDRSAPTTSSGRKSPTSSLRSPSRTGAGSTSPSTSISITPPLSRQANLRTRSRPPVTTSRLVTGTALSPIISPDNEPTSVTRISSVRSSRSGPISRSLGRSATRSRSGPRSPTSTRARSQRRSRSRSRSHSRSPTSTSARSQRRSRSRSASRSPARHAPAPRSPVRSPSIARSPATSRSPVRSPARTISPGRSPVRSPTASPSLARRSTASRSRSRSPGPSTAHSPRRSPVASTAHSPRRSPVASRSPVMGPTPLRSPRHSPMALSRSRSASRSPARARQSASPHYQQSGILTQTVSGIEEGDVGVHDLNINITGSDADEQMISPAGEGLSGFEVAQTSLNSFEEQLKKLIEKARDNESNYLDMNDRAEDVIRNLGIELSEEDRRARNPYFAMRDDMAKSRKIFEGLLERVIQLRNTLNAREIVHEISMVSPGIDRRSSSSIDGLTSRRFKPPFLSVPNLKVSKLLGPKTPEVIRHSCKCEKKLKSR